MRTIISMILLFMSSGVAKSNCMDINVPTSIGIKTFTAEEIKALELRIDELCAISTANETEKSKLGVIAYASIVKTGNCNGNIPLNNFPNSYKDDSLRNKFQGSLQLFCANTNYYNYDSLLGGMLAFYKSIESYDKIALCHGAAQLGEPDGILQSIAFNAFGVNKSPSFIKMKGSIKIICRDLALKKISLDQAIELINQEKSFSRSGIYSEMSESFSENISTSIKGPFIFLGWLIGIVGGAIGIFLSIKKLTK